MLIPQFTLRRLFVYVAGASLVCLILSYAARGQRWAVAMSLGVLALALTLAVHAFFFWLVWLFTSFVDHRRQTRAGATQSGQPIDAILLPPAGDSA